MAMGGGGLMGGEGGVRIDRRMRSVQRVGLWPESVYVTCMVSTWTCMVSTWTCLCVALVRLRYLCDFFVVGGGVEARKR